MQEPVSESAALYDSEYVYQAPSSGSRYVVLLPGLVAGRWMFEKTMRLLASRGYGYLAFCNPFAAAHESAAPLRDIVFERMDRCGIESAVMVGGSFGSRIALDCALASPQRVSTLVLSGAPGTITTEQLGITFRGKFTRSFAVTMLDRLFYDRSCVSEATLADSLKVFSDTRRVLNAMRLMKECNEYDYAAVLARINLFVLMVWGCQDQISPCPLWEELATKVRHGAFFKLDHCGHIPMIEQPNAFNALLLEHLDPSASRRAVGSE